MCKIICPKLHTIWCSVVGNSPIYLQKGYNWKVRYYPVSLADHAFSGFSFTEEGYTALCLGWIYLLEVTLWTINIAFALFASADSSTKLQLIVLAFE